MLLTQVNVINVISIHIPVPAEVKSDVDIWIILHLCKSYFKCNDNHILSNPQDYSFTDKLIYNNDHTSKVL